RGNASGFVRNPSLFLRPNVSNIVDAGSELIEFCRYGFPIGHACCFCERLNSPELHNANAPARTQRKHTSAELVPLAYFRPILGLG
ncbi:MAG: hypothetical protein ACI8PG_005540, partial [Planctomycetota bacterium]